MVKSGSVSSPAKPRRKKVIVKLDIDVRGRARRKITQEQLAEYARFIRRGIRAAGVAAQPPAISFVDDDEMLAINTKFAGEDHATDVLSFEQDAPLLGDVIVSVETAARQARARKADVVDELVHLTLHGVAHLQGYDHANAREERVMVEYVARLMQVAYDYGVPNVVDRSDLNLPRRRKASRARRAPA
jgi:probable rRNA maturation factor